MIIRCTNAQFSSTPLLFYSVCYRAFILITMDNFDKLVIALKDIVIEWKGNKPEDIANEIKNRIDCYCSSDRESSEQEQSGVRDNIFEIQDVLNAL